MCFDYGRNTCIDNFIDIFITYLSRLVDLPLESHIWMKRRKWFFRVCIHTCNCLGVHLIEECENKYIRYFIVCCNIGIACLNDFIRIYLYLDLLFGVIFCILVLFNLRCNPSSFTTFACLSRHLLSCCVS